MKNKGITLIALIISIIVLLILAGVSISLLIGENGVFTKATEVELEYTKAEVEEGFEAIVNEELINCYDKVKESNADISTEYNENYLITLFTTNGYITADTTSDTVRDVQDEIDVYKTYIVNVANFPNPIDKYGKGTIETGNVFTLEVIADETDGTKSSGKYELKYYASGETTNGEVLTTVSLYLTNDS